ncbi:MAG: tetratricopeptide repeat protein [Bryobacterales bacterium]|nr:tetratricopeptide repeat protein [Bryobacterales bacterium]
MKTLCPSPTRRRAWCLTVFVPNTLATGALLAAGDVDEALKHLQKAVVIDPDNPNARYSLATAYARAGRKEEAARQREIFAGMKQKADPEP